MLRMRFCYPLGTLIKVSLQNDSRHLIGSKDLLNLKCSYR
jgi:hypothetical protein